MWFLKRSSKNPKLSPEEEWLQQRDRYLRSSKRLSPEFEAFKRERDRISLGQSFRA